MTINYNITRIVLTGPESTGKSTLSKQLADKYETEFIPEYARTYIEQLHRPYEYDDLCKIASQQILDIHYYQGTANEILFLDTWLHITRVWFLEKYGKAPEWLDDNIDSIPMDLFLVCYPDMPWEQDPVRENEDNRMYLFDKYIKEIEAIGTPFVIIKGNGKERLRNACTAIDAFMKERQ